MLSREMRGVISSQFSWTSSGPKRVLHTWIGLTGYSSPHSRHLSPSAFGMFVSPLLLSQELMNEKRLAPPCAKGAQDERRCAFVVPPGFAAISRIAASAGA